MSRFNASLGRSAGLTALVLLSLAPVGTSTPMGPIGADECAWGVFDAGDQWFMASPVSSTNGCDGTFEMASLDTGTVETPSMPDVQSANVNVDDLVDMYQIAGTDYADQRELLFNLCNKGGASRMHYVVYRVTVSVLGPESLPEPESEWGALAVGWVAKNTCAYDEPHRILAWELGFADTAHWVIKIDVLRPEGGTTMTGPRAFYELTASTPGLDTGLEP